MVRLARPISDFYVAGRLMPAMFNGMAIAASLTAVLAFVAVTGAVGPNWEGSASLLLGGGLGLAFSSLVLARYLRKFGGYTLPDFLAERFGGEALRPLGVFAVLLCSFPALAAVLLGLGTLAARVFLVDVPTGVAVGVAMFLFATLIGGMRSLSLSQIAYYAVLLVGSVVGLVIVLRRSGTALPGLEGVNLGGLLVGFEMRAFAAEDSLNRLALIFCLASGTASLPYILMRSFTTPSVEEARASYLSALAFAGVLCAAAPAYGALFGTVSIEGSVAPVILKAALVVGAIAALLAAGSGLLLAIANTLSYDLYFKTVHTRASTDQRLLVARGTLVLVAALAAGAALMLPKTTLTIAASALSLAASAFLPALVLGIWWQRTSMEAALAGMIAGLTVCLYYMLAPEYMPFAFYDTSSFLSNATRQQAAAYAAAQESFYLTEGAAREAAFADWERTARGIANWWGVNRTFASLFAVPVGFAVTIAVSPFAPAPSAEVRSFVRELRNPTT
ncbi:MAG: sodium:solute symporter family transporter [Methyloceanibacter sp.]